MDEAAPDSAETQRLLQQIQEGSPQAFDELFAKHRPYLRQVIDLRLDAELRARVDPSDVVQETHLEAFRRLPDYLERRPMAFRLWLRKTAHERLLMVQEILGEDPIGILSGTARMLSGPRSWLSACGKITVCGSLV